MCTVEDTVATAEIDPIHKKSSNAECSDKICEDDSKGNEVVEELAVSPVRSNKLVLLLGFGPTKLFLFVSKLQS